MIHAPSPTNLVSSLGAQTRCALELDFNCSMSEYHCYVFGNFIRQQEQKTGQRRERNKTDLAAEQNGCRNTCL